MRHIYLIACLILAATIEMAAKEMCDTLYTPDRDLVVVRYNVENEGDRAVITFRKPQLGLQSDSKLRKKHSKDLDKVRAIIFERIGAYNDTEFSGINVSAFSVPRGMRFTETLDGYYILNEGQTNRIEFKWGDDETATVNLPIFITLHKKKNKYEILCQTTKPLKVELRKSNGTPSSRRDEAHARTEQRETVITTDEEEDDENNRLIEITNCINTLRNLLAQEDDYPFSAPTSGEYNRLLLLQNGVTDSETLDKIDDIKRQYGEREKELKEKLKDQQAAEQAEAEKKAKQLADEEEQKRIDEQKKQEERTIWMIVGGVILAVLAFVGNNLFQHFNQKSIMEQTLNAQGEAKLRAREIVRNKTHQMVNQGKTKLRKQLNGNNDKDTDEVKGTDKTNGTQEYKPSASDATRQNRAAANRRNGSLNRSGTRRDKNGRITI